MKRHDGDLADWWNTLHPAARARVLAALGLDTPPPETAIDDDARLDIARRLSKDLPPRRPH